MVMYHVVNPVSVLTMYYFIVRCGTVTSVRCLPEKFCAFINFADKYEAGRAIRNLQVILNIA